MKLQYEADVRVVCPQTRFLAYTVCASRLLNMVSLQQDFTE